ncbi:Crp/Fnr family transcriptional regulator [Burkholderia guangdongensis]|uniref:Crp/Fnr family transcriptional regulator n=1 Tax=Burkholderia guangdongensis TaxID=1792500 RepID=UPI0015C6D768|nr:Crp/Fnr family transcriptional regulator [Burkholderia guangdongensis]
MNSPVDRYLPLLDTQPWFAALPPALRAALLSHASLRRLPAGRALFRRGDPPCGLYAVLSGSLTIGAVDAHGKEALLTVAEPPTWFGEIAVFDGRPRTHDAIALEDSLLLNVPHAPLVELLDATPVWWRHVALLMAQKLRLSFLSVEAMSMMPAAQRLAMRLLMIVDGYGGISVGRTRIRLPQEKLAAMLSLTRQTTNQLLKSLEAAGAVRVHVGEIEVVDVDALRRASRPPDAAR